MLPQPPDSYSGPFPLRDPRFPLITKAHDSGEAFSRADQTHAMQHRAMDKFATRHGTPQEIHQDRLGLHPSGHQHGAPMAMDFAEHEADSDDDNSVYTMFQKGHRRYELQPRSPYQSHERLAIEDARHQPPPPDEDDDRHDPGSRGNDDGGDPPPPPEEPRRGGPLKTIGEWMKWAMSHDPDAHQHNGDYSYYGEKEERKPDAYDLYGAEETHNRYEYNQTEMPATPPPAAKAKARPRASSSAAAASSSAGAASAGASSSSHQRPFVDVGQYQGATVEVSDEEPFEPNQPAAPARRRRKTALERAQELAAEAEKYGRTKQFDDPKRQPPKPRGG